MLLAGSASTAQQLSANDLLAMAGCMDYECINTLAEAKAYEVERNKETPAYNLYVFHSTLEYQAENNKKVMRPHRLELTIIEPDNSITLNYFTAEKRERNELIDGFEELGFTAEKAMRSKSVSDNVAVAYRHPDHPDLELRVTNYEREKSKQRKTVQSAKDYIEYGFEIQWLTKPEPSEREYTPDVQVKVAD